MRIVHVSTFDTEGGAARAAFRLHAGLQRVGHESCLLVRYRKSADTTVIKIVDQASADVQHKALLLEQGIQPHYINARRSDFGNTLFSLPYPGYDLSALPQVQAADIINLHWIAYFQSPVTLNKLLAKGKPAVWTLHDQWPLTGGCHYTAGCLNYRQDCAACPQLVGDVHELPAAILKDKDSCLQDVNLTIVAPSRWLAACAKESRLFGRRRVEVIPYSLDTDIFHPLPKPEAKAKVGLDAHKVTLLFGAQDGAEKRKGFQVLLAAIRHCLANGDFQQWLANDRLRILCFGYPPAELAATNIPTVSLGQLNSDEDMSTVYSAADLFILPSLEDNLPNTLLEAMSCGTPVIASNVGGIPELVVEGVTGYLTPVGNASRLAETILTAILSPDRLNTMGRQSRDRIEKEYKLEVQARRYLDLYAELHQSHEIDERAGLQSFRAAQTPQQENTTTATLDPEVGRYFKHIYEPVLLEALQEFAPFAYEKWQASESDRAARLIIIEEQGQRLGEIEAERNTLRFQLADLQRHFEAAEADRAARLTLLAEQSQRLGQMEVERNDLRFQLADRQQQFEAAEADQAARLIVIEEQGQRLGEIEAERNTLRFQLADRQQQFEAAEADRAVRLVVIEEQSQRLGQLEAERNDLCFQLADRQQQFEAAEADRAARLAVIAEQSQRLGQLEAERNDLRFQLADRQQQFEAAEADRAARLTVIEEQGQRLGEIEAERNNLCSRLADLQRQFEAAETDRVAHLAIIEEQGQRLAEIEAERNNLRFQFAQSEEIRGNQAGLIEAQEHQLHVSMAQLRKLQESLHTIQSGRVYRIVRRLGGWK